MGVYDCWFLNEYCLSPLFLICRINSNIRYERRLNWGMGPLLTVLLSMLFFKKRPTLITALGFISGSTGVSLTVLFGSGKLQGINLGDFEIFLSIFIQSFGFIIINKASKTMDSVLLTAYMLLIASIFLFVSV